MILRQHLSQPSHGPVQMLQVQLVGTFNGVVCFPLLGGTVAAGSEQAMQHREENSPFHGEVETAALQQSRQNLVDGTGLPEPLKDERRSNFGVVRGDAAGMRMRAEEGKLFGEPRERLHQRVGLAAGEEFVEATEAGQDALLHLAVGPDVIDEEQIGAGTVGLGANEQCCAPVSPSLSPFHQGWIVVAIVRSG